MRKIVEDKIEDVRKLCVQYDIKTLYLFGSVCTDNFSQNSDIDVLIAFKEGISIE